MRWRFIKIVCFLLCASFMPKLYAQSLNPYVDQTFRGIQFVNYPTTETLLKGSFNFNIQHRFGLADVNEDLLKDFLGMDKSSNIRFEFNFPITQHAYIGFGRTKDGKYYDLNAKVRMLRQRKDYRIPVSAAFYVNAAYMSDDFPLVQEDNFFSDSITPFSYKDSHRWKYQYQLILAHKLTRWCSVEFAPIYVHENIVDINRDNYTLGFPVMARFKVAMFSSILVEYTPVLNKQEDFYDSYALAFEVGTAGHSFQFTLGNSKRILGQNLLTMQNSDIFDGKFYLGFNIHRRLWLRKSLAQ